jgi:hypothetical protein
MTQSIASLRLYSKETVFNPPSIALDTLSRQYELTRDRTMTAAHGKFERYSYKDTRANAVIYPGF